MEELLAAFGLDAAITEADDAELWATVLAAHVPDPWDCALNVEGLSFEVGGLNTVHSYDPSDIPEGERWVFERRGPGRLRALRAEPPGTAPRYSVPPRIPRWPHIEIAVSRPTRDRDDAVVDASHQSGPLAGRAKTRVWARQAVNEGGPVGWTPTERVLFSSVR